MQPRPIRPGAKRYVTKDTQWWVVRPRISGAGVSGFETILSGGYVTFEPGTEEANGKLEFVGLEEPPIPAKDQPGVQLTLVTDQLGGLDAGASVFFRDIEVGDVLHYALAKDGQGVEIRIVIEGDYADRVTTATRFWNAGGVDLSAGSLPATPSTFARCRWARLSPTNSRRMGSRCESR